MAEMKHSIRVVSLKTGLTPHVIRVWERRYGAVKPERTGNNRRLYSDEEIERLCLLRRAIAAGHSICHVAGLSQDRLSRIADEAEHDRQAHPVPTAPEHCIEECLASIRRLNTRELEESLAKGIVTLGQHGLLERVIGPLAQRIGDLWQDGSLMAAHEHFASAAIRGFLVRTAKPFSDNNASPVLVVTTPAGQLHELGAVMVAAAANDLGWRVVYLGPSLPAAEIAGVAAQNHARAVALSIVYPEDDPRLGPELEALRAYLPAEIALLVGGRAAEGYFETLGKVGALRPNDFKDLYRHLGKLRAGGGKQVRGVS